MIIRKQIYTNKVPIKRAPGSGIEFKPIFKKIEPNANNSAMRDSNELLKPIKIQNHREMEIELNGQQYANMSSKERTERNLWRNDEVMEMLYTMQEVKALEKLNDKTVKSENVFKDVEMIMNRNGYVKKSHVQIWTKWKFLKSTYMTSRRNGVIPRMVPPQVYEMIHKMITGLNQSMADSCSSVDGDNSSLNGMVISGIEGGLNEESNANGQEDDSFGVAHPIFGFRLGTVKSEPEDTGYEANETNENENNDSDKDPLEEKEDKEVKEEEGASPNPNTECEEQQKTLEIPHRGRGRPPKNMPAATSTPMANQSPATKTAQMPPLRVAPFAKAINAAAAAPNRPPPPLTMPPTPRIRVANLSNLKNAEPVKLTQPKLTPKPLPQQQAVTSQPLRIVKETTQQSRSSNTPSPSYPKMKQIPMRKTPYSLRPDRAIPDLDDCVSPPPTPIEKPIPKRLEEVTSTKHLVMQSNANNSQNNANRKRRPDWTEPTLTTKQIKLTHNSLEGERKTPYTLKTDEATKYGQVMQNVVMDLSFSLRKLQTEMMTDFFNKQNELMEKEHKFQMQQDRLIMKAFQEQTQEIMQSVRQIVGSLKSDKSEAQDESSESLKEARGIRKNRVQQKQQPREQEEEMDEDQMQVNEEDEEQEVEEEDQDIEHDAEELYSYGEDQQDQEHENNDHEANEEEEMENNIEEDLEEDEDHQDMEQPQSDDEQHENGLEDEEHNNSNDSDEDEHDP